MQLQWRNAKPDDDDDKRPDTQRYGERKKNFLHKRCLKLQLKQQRDSNCGCVQQTK